MCCFSFYDVFYLLVDLYFGAVAPKLLLGGLGWCCLMGGLWFCCVCLLFVLAAGWPGGGPLMADGGGECTDIKMGQRAEWKGRRECQCGLREWSQEAEWGEG